MQLLHRRLHFRSTPSSWTPASESGLKAWYDPTDADTLYQDSGLTTHATADTDPVGGMTDKSGNGFNLLQATSGSRPLLKTAVQNGNNALRFDGTDDCLKTGTMFNAASNYSVFVVSKAGGLDVTGRALLSLGKSAGDTNGWLHLLYRDNVTNKFRVLYASNGDGANLVPQYPLATYPTAWTQVSVIAGTNGIFRLNGAEQDSDAITQASFISTIFQLATYYTSYIPYQWKGDIGEVFIYDHALDATAYANAESYLKTKWGT